MKYLISQAYLQIYTGTASKIQVNIPGKAVHPLIKGKYLRGEDCMQPHPSLSSCLERGDEWEEPPAHDSGKKSLMLRGRARS